MAAAVTAAGNGEARSQRNRFPVGTCYPLSRRHRLRRHRCCTRCIHWCKRRTSCHRGREHAGCPEAGRAEAPAVGVGGKEEPRVGMVDLEARQQPSPPCRP